MLSVTRHVCLFFFLLAAVFSFYTPASTLRVTLEDFQKSYAETLHPNPVMSSQAFATQWAKSDLLTTAIAALDDPDPAKGMQNFYSAIAEITQQAAPAATPAAGQTTIPVAMGTPSPLTLEEIMAQEAAGKTLDEFVADKIAGRLESVRGAAWKEIFQAVQGASNGSAVPPGWDKRLEKDSFASVTGGYFSPSEPPFRELSSRYTAFEKESYGGGVFWIVLEDAEPPQYLSVSYISSRERPSYATPASLRYPFRFLSLWLVLFGLAGYAFLPWRKPSSNVLCYPPLRHVILVDFAGVIWCTFFFAVPFLISQSHPFDPDWAILFWITWLMALLGCLFFVLATLNEAYSIRILPDRLQVSGLSSKEYLYGDMLDYAPFTLEFSGGAQFFLRMLILLMVLSQKRGTRAGRQALGGLDDPFGTGIVVNLRDGNILRLWNNEMPEFGRLISVLEKNGVQARPQPAFHTQDQS